MGEYLTREEILAAPDVGQPNPAEVRKLTVTVGRWARQITAPVERFALRMREQMVGTTYLLYVAIVSGQMKQGDGRKAAELLHELFGIRKTGKVLSGRRVRIPHSVLIKAAWRVLRSRRFHTMKPTSRVPQARTEIHFKLDRLLIEEGTETDVGSRDLSEWEVDHTAALRRKRGKSWSRDERESLDREETRDGLELEMVAVLSKAELDEDEAFVVVEFYRTEASADERAFIRAIYETGSAAEALRVIGAAGSRSLYRSLQQKLQLRLKRRLAA